MANLKTKNFVVCFLILKELMMPLICLAECYNKCGLKKDAHYLSIPAKFKFAFEFKGWGGGGGQGRN